MTALKSIRIRTGKTQSIVADELGLSKSTYGAWETGRISLNEEHILVLAEYFNCTPNEIIGYNDTGLPNYSDLTEDERYFLHLFNSLPQNNKNSIIDIMQSCVKKHRPRI